MKDLEKWVEKGRMVMKGLGKGRERNLNIVKVIVIYPLS